jgi:hypothetical protein
MKTEIDSALTDAGRSTMPIILDQGAFNLLADSYVAKAGFRLLQNKDHTFTLSRNYGDNLVPFFDHLLSDAVIAICQHTYPKTWGIVDDILSDVLSPANTEKRDELGDGSKENPTAATKWDTKPIITGLTLFPTRNIAGNIDYSRAIQRSRSDIIALAIENLRQQFPNVHLQPYADFCRIDSWPMEKNQCVMIRNGGVAVFLRNKAGEYFAAYQITINSTDAPGRVELSCVYVVSAVLSSVSRNPGSGGMKS